MNPYNIANHSFQPITVNYFAGGIPRASDVIGAKGTQQI
jgi:hypothetical protein